MQVQVFFTQTPIMEETTQATSLTGRSKVPAGEGHSCTGGLLSVINVQITWALVDSGAKCIHDKSEKHQEQWAAVGGYGNKTVQVKGTKFY